MRRLTFRKFDADGVENGSYSEIEPTDKQRLLIFVVKSDDIEETTLARLKGQLAAELGRTSPNTRVCVMAAGVNDSFEVYEEESTES